MPSKLELLTGRNYLSYSGMDSLLACGEKFRLERVMNAPQAPAWWFLAGDVIHRATEICDLEGIDRAPDAYNVFHTLFETAVYDIEDMSKMRVGGRATKEFPNKEDRAFWLAKGPGQVWGWVEWRNRRFQEGWQFFELPDGSPAVEVAFEVEFANTLVKGYIDRVMVNDNGELMVVDLKSGSREPESALQLGVYALGMKRKFGVTPPLGAYFMTRKAELTEPKSLVNYSENNLGIWFDKARFIIENEAFIPHVTSWCNTCSVAPYCVAVGGNPDGLATALNV